MQYTKAIEKLFADFYAAYKAGIVEKAQRIYPDNPELREDYATMYTGAVTVPVLISNRMIARHVKNYGKEHGWSGKRRFFTVLAAQFGLLTLVYGPNAIKHVGRSYVDTGRELKSFPAQLRKAVAEAKAAGKAEDGDTDTILNWQDATEADIQAIQDFLVRSDSRYLFGDPEKLEEAVQEMLGDKGTVKVTRLSDVPVAPPLPRTDPDNLD